MKLPKFSLFLGIYIIVSASFMQQVWAVWKKIFGIKVLILSFIFLCLWAISAILYKSIKAGLSSKKIILICIISILGFIFAWRQPYLAEKAHVLEYSLLAWLLLRDLGKINRNMLKNIFYTFIFTTAVGCMDEGFQRLLPWRVFEIRDIATNLISGVLGILLFLTQQNPKENTPLDGAK